MPVFLGVIVLLIVGGGIYIYQNKNTETLVTTDNTEQADIVQPEISNNASNDISKFKTYTSNKQGYSFQYPEKLSLSASGDVVNLSHSIPFENYDGGCDMKGDAELSKTLQDFGLAIKVVAGGMNPPYVDGTYSKGALKGQWAYMGAEGCGVTTYYFPATENRTLLVTQNHLQVLSNNVTQEVKAKVLAVPGVISSEESKVILDQILSTFKFTKTSDTYTYKNHGFTIELPKGFVPKEEQAEGGPWTTIYLPDNFHMKYISDYSFYEKYELPNYSYQRDEKIGETTFKFYRIPNDDAGFYLFRQGNVGYEFSLNDIMGYQLKELLKTFHFVGWAQN